MFPYKHSRYHRHLLIAAATLAGATIGLAQGTTTASLSPAAPVTSSTLIPCAELPAGDLTDAQLLQMVPDGSPGYVRISWKTESQEEVYGFNILRADKAEGPYTPVNKAIIPGEGTSSMPTAYCHQDTGLPRGQVFFYQIEEVSNSGAKMIIEGTAATRIKVKTVEEERAWLKKKAAEAKASQ